MARIFDLSRPLLYIAEWLRLTSRVFAGQSSRDPIGARKQYDASAVAALRLSLILRAIVDLVHPYRFAFRSCEDECMEEGLALSVEALTKPLGLILFLDLVSAETAVLNLVIADPEDPECRFASLVFDALHNDWKREGFPRIIGMSAHGPIVSDEEEPITQEQAFALLKDALASVTSVGLTSGGGSA